MLDKRLRSCYDLVGGEGIVCDVGTDHAYLAAELIKGGKCDRVIASDIKAGPLEAAKNTIEKYGLSANVDLVLSDGLSNISLDGVSDIVIAGMGGETVAGIVAGAVARKDIPENMRFILQPMTKPELLRKKIYECGLKIISEKTVRDDKKEYITMCAVKSSDFRLLTEFESVRGFHGDREYLSSLAAVYRRNAASLESGGYKCRSVHSLSIAEKLEKGTEKYDIGDIFYILDTLFPFSAQEKWDNSGLIIESEREKCDKVVLSLDITSDVVKNASDMGAGLIISHHPVIFEPLKKIRRHSPVAELVKNDISAICMHTNLDIAECGTNGVILEKLRKNFDFACAPEPFEDLGNGRTLGRIVTLKESVTAESFAGKLKEIFGCPYVRISRAGGHPLSRIAFCSGSGGSMLGLAEEKGCDGLITGDVKHDVWTEAVNRQFALFDCGHFYTENPVLEQLRKVLEENFPLLDVEISDLSVDPVEYI